MDIVEKKSPHGPVMCIDRSLDRTNARDLDKALEVIFAKEKGPIWLDIGQLQSVDSAGLTLLLRWHRRALAEERRFALVESNAFHRKLLEITRLDNELVIYDEPGGVRIRSAPVGRFGEYAPRGRPELVGVG